MSDIPYRAAGTFDGEAYIERKADVELQNQIFRNQRFPYIVAARQSGKSSLIIRTFKTLDPDKFVCAFVDLAPMAIADYRSFWQEFLVAVARSARLDRKPLELHDPEDTLRAWLEQVEPRRLVVFVDEIDALLAASFREQFFSKVRTFFNNRAIDRLFTQLQFVLVGSAHPSSLITDPKRSPFNVGIEVMLDELTEQQIADLTSHLEDSGALVSPGVADWVYHHTNGSVYLSQLVLEHLWGEAIIGLERGKASITEVDVDTTVQWVVGQASRNVHFENIFRLVSGNDALREVLGRLHEGAEIGEKDRQALQLTGISSGETPFRNRIYQRVFGTGGPLCLIDSSSRSQMRLSTGTRVQLKPGSSLQDGKYRLVRKIGQGGFGAVWMALQTDVGRPVAVKVLHAHLADDTSRRERFFRGAREMSKIVHPAIVQVLEPHGEEDGDCFFVMEYVKGHDFRSAIKSRFVRVQDVVGIVTEVGHALAHAHRHGLVHRDVKPSNILIDADRHPRLTDFDLVRVSDQTGGTQTGAMGTFIYTAPEVMREAKEADETADIYSLAMTCVFGLYGRDVPMEVLRDAGTFIDNNLECTRAVKEVLKRAVTWQKEHRYRDAAEFCQDLRHAWDTGVLPAKKLASKPAKPSAPKRPRPSDRRPSLIPPLTRGPKQNEPTPSPAATPEPVSKSALRMPTRLYVEGHAKSKGSNDLGEVPAPPPSAPSSSDEPSLVTGAALVDAALIERSGTLLAPSEQDFDADTESSMAADIPRARDSASRSSTLEGVEKIRDEEESSQAQEASQAQKPSGQNAASVVAAIASQGFEPTDEEVEDTTLAESPGIDVAAVGGQRKQVTAEPERAPKTEVESSDDDESRPVVVVDITPSSEHAPSASGSRPILWFVAMVAVVVLVIRTFENPSVIEPVPDQTGTKAEQSGGHLATRNSASEETVAATTDSDVGSTVQTDAVELVTTAEASDSATTETTTEATTEVALTTSTGEDSTATFDETTSSSPMATTESGVTTNDVETTGSTTTGEEKVLSVAQLIRNGCRDVASKNKKRVERGVATLLEAHDRDQSNLKMELCLGRGYLAQKKARSALRFFKEAIDQDLNNREALLGAAKACEALAAAASSPGVRDDYIEDAIRYYRRANANQDVDRLKQSLRGGGT